MLDDEFSKYIYTYDKSENGSTATNNKNLLSNTYYYESSPLSILIEDSYSKYDGFKEFINDSDLLEDDKF
jgi:hypothetical protein